MIQIAPPMPPSSRSRDTRAYTLTELMAAVAIIGLLAALALPRVNSVQSNGQSAACQVNRTEIELQASLWRRVNGVWPATTLTDIGIDTAYFPDGIPTCPVDGAAYQIDADGRVVGHAH